MIVLTANDSKALDAWAKVEGSVSFERLMESAGTTTALHAWQAWKKQGGRTPIIVVCGPGNNGGDGLVIARHLIARGVPTEGDRALSIFVTQDNVDGLAPLRALNVNIVNKFSAGLFKNAFVVDALFGVGLNRDVDEQNSEIINSMNETARFILSVDIPSGLDADTGHVRGISVCANETVTFGRAKIGFFIEKGPAHVGRIRIEPLSFPQNVIKKIQPRLQLYRQKIARKDLPKRDASGNKFSFGRVLVIAGRDGAWGAGLMCASSALQSGAGYVTWAIIKEDENTKIPPEVSLSQPELLTQVISVADIKKWKADQFAAVVVGPGLGRESVVREITEAVLKSGVPTLLDADVLSLFGTDLVSTLKSTRTSEMLPVILAPHEGELAKLLGVSSAEVQADRRSAAEKIHSTSGAIVVAKGFHTLVAGIDSLTVIPSGNSALAKAGSGDVLSGVIAAMLAMKMKPEKAAVLGCHLHGLAADLWLKDGLSVHALQPHQIPIFVQEIMQMMFHRIEFKV